MRRRGALGALLATLAFTTFSCSRSRRAADRWVVESGIGPSSATWVCVTERPLRSDGTRDALLNPATGQRIEIDPPPTGRPAYSLDGRVVAWMTRLRELPALVTARLDGAEPRLSRRSLSPPVLDSARLAVSPGGRRVAAVSGSSVTVCDIESGEVLSNRLLPAARGPGYSAFFVGEETLRLDPVQHFDPPGKPRLPSSADELYELDLPSGRLASTGSVPFDFPGLRLRPGCDGRSLLALERRRTRVTLRDGRSGALRASLPTADTEPIDLGVENERLFGKVGSAMFLTDGRIALFARGKGGRELRLFSADGKPQHERPLSISGVQPLAEANGFLAVADTRGNVDIIDEETGTVLERLEGLRPLDPGAFWNAPCLALGSRGWAIDAQGTVVAVDLSRRRSAPPLRRD